MRQNKQIWLIIAVIGVLFIGVIAFFNRDTAVAETTGGIQPRAYLPITMKPLGNVLFGPIHSGEGTYYFTNNIFNCGLPAPSDDMYAAMNDTDYGQADLCGAYIEATGPKGTVVVQIIDRCHNCPKGDVDFSPEAFELIGDLPDGRIDITWQLLSPEMTTPIEYYFDPDSHEYWAGVQVRKHRNPIAKLDYWDGSKWVNIPRERWNRFDVSGMGPGPYRFRVTDYFGNKLIDDNIPLTVGGTVTGSSQFPSP